MYIHFQAILMVLHTLYLCVSVCVGEALPALSRVVYLLEWNAPYTCVTSEEFPPDSEHVFLPDWYLQKQTPPPDSTS